MSDFPGEITKQILSAPAAIIRSRRNSLTARGRATHDKVIVAAFDRERRLLSCLNKDEREVLIDLLRRLHENLGAVTGGTES